MDFLDNVSEDFERPEIIGGGNSIPSVAFLPNCRAKSDACHHSRNFNAKIDVGRRIFRELKARSYMIRGSRIDVTPRLPPRAPFPDPAEVEGASKAAIAL